MFFLLNILMIIACLFPGQILANEPITSIAMVEKQDVKKAELGRLLFYDVRLSGNNTVSCASCHVLNKGGDDGKVTSVGVYGRTGGRNTPTVINSAINAYLLWDGRVISLEDQIDFSVNNPNEMDGNWDDIVSKLQQDPKLKHLFKESYGNSINVEDLKDAIAVFERTLVFVSRFDRYLSGRKDAITDFEKKGYDLFKAYGCSSCHQGRSLGANMFAKMGVFGDYFSNRGNIAESDFGRFNVTGKDSHKYHFKVPSLRNVALTAPYFHDGSAVNLHDAIYTMSKYQLGRSITEEDIAAISAFLKTLTGEMDAYEY